MFFMSKKKKKEFKVINNLYFTNCIINTISIICFALLQSIIAIGASGVVFNSIGWDESKINKLTDSCVLNTFAWSLLFIAYIAFNYFFYKKNCKKGQIVLTVLGIAYIIFAIVEMFNFRLG